MARPLAFALLCALPLALPPLAVAQNQPQVRAASPSELQSFELREGTVQSLQLPAGGWERFEVPVVLDGRPRTLVLAPYSIRGAGFQLLVTDATGTHPVSAPEETTYRGMVVGEAGSVVTAALFEGALDARVHDLGGKGDWFVQPLARVLPYAAPDLHVVYRAEDVLPSSAQCEVGDVHGHGSPTGAPEGISELRYCDIALDCDVAYYLRNGASVAQTSSAAGYLLLDVSFIYQTDVEIRYSLTSLIVRTVPTYTSGSNTGCSTSGLLQEFASRWQSNHTSISRDVAHLISGEGVFSGTVGCAYIGVVCTSNGYGVSRAVSSNNAQNIQLLAHELGHNWSATHCDSAPPCQIMCASIGGCTGIGSSFGPGERAQILAHKGTRSCLTAARTIDPNPALWYRLTTLFQPTLSLDVVNDGANNNRLQMAASGAFTGQYWRFTRSGFGNTWRISCLWQGENLPMDTINGGAENNRPILAPIGAWTGQLWTLHEVPGYPGYVALTNDFRGPHLALEGFATSLGAGARPQLQTFGPFTGQLWLLTPLGSVSPARSTSFGSNCVGRAGRPTLGILPQGDGPWIGETMSGEVTNVLNGMASQLVFGGRLASPLDLGFLSSPNCNLYLDLGLLVTIPVGGGRATFAFSVPRSPFLVGATFPMQALVIDPGRGPSNPLVATTNGLDLTIGMR
ncbi:MAG: hypothetical protein IPN34_19195 [Planctomycetes bacterium]|nr:hypothetical protein [Planctomycetota bacterium]